MLTNQVWTALRRLGLTQGWVTCLGMDAATFTGHTRPEEYGEPGSYAEWSGPILPPGDVDDAELTPPQDTDPSADAAIANLPYADLHMRSQHGAKTLERVHAELLMAVVPYIAPGGYLVAMATRHLMDGTSPHARQALAQELDLVGALRLPGTTYHPSLSPEQTAPVDVLVLRRRPDGEPDRPASWLTSGPVVFPGGQANVNTYFTNHYPHNVLGQVSFVDDPDRSAPRMAVVSSGRPLEAAIRLGLSQIVHEARATAPATQAPSVRPEPRGTQLGASHQRRDQPSHPVLGT